MIGYIKGKFNLLCFFLGHDEDLENEASEWGYCKRCKNSYQYDGWCKPLSYRWQEFIRKIKSKFEKEDDNELPF